MKHITSSYCKAWSTYCHEFYITNPRRYSDTAQDASLTLLAALRAATTVMADQVPVYRLFPFKLIHILLFEEIIQPLCSLHPTVCCNNFLTNHIRQSCICEASH